MPNRTLYIASDEGYSYLVDNPEDHPDSRKATETDLTTERLAQYLDDECENDNYHDFVGIHLPLARLIAKSTTDEAARRIMRDIAMAGGIRCLRWQ